MGILELNKECYTCGFDSTGCPGHVGYIKLATPIFNEKLLTTVHYILKCVCLECGALRVPVDFAAMKGLTSTTGQRRLKALIKICKKAKTCPKCESLLPTTFEKDGLRCGYPTASGIQSVAKTAAHVLDLFGKIDAETVTMLGFNDSLAPNPAFKRRFLISNDEVITEHCHQNALASLIFTVLPVIPPFARTWVIRNGIKSDDDLTEKYNSIVKVNRRLLDPSLTGFAREEAARKLEEHVHTLIDNHHDTCGGMNRTHRGLADRIQGKGNRMQENVMAKRADFSARTVLASGGPEIRFGQIGVPFQIATILTVQERVTHRNYHKISLEMEKGTINSLWRWNPSRNRMSYKGLATAEIKRKVGLRVNDTVERPLRNGDWVLLNRQPTLRRESMLGCQVVVISDSVFRIPLALTSPLAADFDGDEANIHVPQNLQATAECMTLMSAAEHIVTCQRNAPICGIVQDGLVTAYLLTSGLVPPVAVDAFYDALLTAEVPFNGPDFWARVYAYYPEIVEFDEKMGKHRLRGRRVPGKVVFSALLPPDFDYWKQTSVDPARPIVKTKRGIILPDSGPLCKKSLGAKENSIIHVLWLDYSPTVAQDFITHVQILTDLISPRLGFSMGIEDCCVTDSLPIRKLLVQMDAQYASLLDRPRNDGRTEQKLNAELNETMSLAPSVVKGLLVGGSHNAAVVMKTCGGKGQDVNATQIVAFVGQQNVGGKRAELTLSGRTRTLPVFPPGDRSPASRGFIYGNYLTGQQPHEAFFAAMSGRSGIIDTACKTSETGYIQKRIVQKVCDLQVRIDSTVRDARDKIIQFVYGGDGMDPRYLATPDGCSFPFFVNLKRLASRYAARHFPERPGSPLSPSMLEAIMSHLYIGLPDSQTEAHTLAQENVRTVLTLLSKDVRVAPAYIPEFCKDITDHFRKALAQEGDMVGQHLASSMGEITTQLVLSFFHFAGMSLKDASLGVPRFVELLNLTKEPVAPSCTVYPLKSGRQEAQRVARKLVKLVLQDLLVEPPILLYAGKKDFDPAMRSPADFTPYARYVQPWYVTLALQLGIASKEPLVQWVLRLRFDRQKLIFYGLSLRDVLSKIEKNGQGRFPCIPSPCAQAEMYIFPNLEDLRSSKSVHILVSGNACVTDENYEFFIVRDVATHFLTSLSIQGLPGIQKAVATEVPNTSTWNVETLGANLQGLLGHPLLDPEQAISNNPREVCAVLGIEAARRFLVEEITRVLSFDGTYINARHVPLLVDTMCHRGFLTAVRRDGIDRDEVGPIAKAAFEMTVDNVFLASIFSEHDDLEGFSARIMFGQTTKCGTGSVVAT